MKSKCSKQSGLSLIEIMIALVIGLMLVAGAIQLFISNKATYRVENSLARLQETGRFIVDIMSKEIRMAGYNGCASRGDITPNTIANAPSPYDFTPENALRGSESTGTTTWVPVLPTMLPANVRANTDTITIQRAHECGVTLTASAINTAASLSVEAPNACSFQQSNPVMVTDCANADIFQIDNTPANTGPSATINHTTTNGNNSAQPLTSSYTTDALLHRIISKTFYIAPSTDDANEPALWMDNWIPNNDTNMTAADDFTSLEYAEGVEDMQILYGIDTGGADQYADSYVLANAVDTASTDWIDVRSVRINLLLRSEDNITTEPRAIAFNGATVNGGSGADRRLRMVYSATISLRNRMP